MNLTPLYALVGGRGTRYRPTPQRSCRGSFGPVPSNQVGQGTPLHEETKFPGNPYLIRAPRLRGRTHPQIIRAHSLGSKPGCRIASPAIVVLRPGRCQIHYWTDLFLPGGSSIRVTTPSGVDPCGRLHGAARRLRHTTSGPHQSPGGCNPSCLEVDYVQAGGKTHDGWPQPCLPGAELCAP